MSSPCTAGDEVEDGNTMMFCAGCGKAEGDDIKLKRCTACDLVKYCSDECERDNISQHLSACQKRAAGLRDKILFKQPESSHLGDCPICCLPIPLDKKKSSLMSCCCKLICIGCSHANAKRQFELRLERKCPFCRHPPPISDEEEKIRYMKRVEANDPIAMLQIGLTHCIEGECGKAFEYWTKAAELGNMDAHNGLSRLYHIGQGVEKNEEKELYHLQQASIGGNADARYDLGRFEGENNGKMDRAFKHFIIAANMGHDKSLELLKKNYANGFVAKEDFSSALRAHYAAVVAMKSPQREEAEAARQKMEANSAARQE